jgi:hypothetical protein
MKQDGIAQYLYEGVDISKISSNSGKCNFKEFDLYMPVFMEAVYVVDFFERCFSYVPVHDLFLCGYSRERVMQLGYNFYPEIVHADDLPLLIKIHRVILNSPYIAEKERQNNMWYFYFTLRI